MFNTIRGLIGLPLKLTQAMKDEYAVACNRHGPGTLETLRLRELNWNVAGYAAWADGYDIEYRHAQRRLAKNEAYRVSYGGTAIVAKGDDVVVDIDTLSDVYNQASPLHPTNRPPTVADEILSGLQAYDKSLDQTAEVAGGFADVGATASSPPPPESPPPSPPPPAYDPGPSYESYSPPPPSYDSGSSYDSGGSSSSSFE